jgi:formamidopyrimidine-DNA glycosylase
MPELPEVETVRRGLERGVVSRVVSEVEVRHPRAVRRHLPGAEDFAVLLAGRRIEAALRRGKYLWLPLDSGDALVAHLGMSGQLLLLPPTTPDGPHLRVRFRFADEEAGCGQLRFVDQRTFGGLAVAAGGAALPASLEHIALDPLDPLFDDEVFVTTVRRRRTGIKRALLDQTVIGGVGNIYADEALWRARLHWARPTETLPRADLRRLLAAVRGVLADAVAAGGTSFDALYVNVNGQSGWFDRSLSAYGRENEPCERCGTPIVRERFMNRSSYRCPHCQPVPRRARY